MASTPGTDGRRRSRTAGSSWRREADAAVGAELRYRELFDHIKSGVAVYKAIEEGSDFIIVDFNRAAERIERVTRPEVLGLRVTKAFPGIRDFGLLEVFRRVWRTGTAESHPVGLYKDDRVVGWRENHVYRLPSGEIVAVYEDATERKRAEKALEHRLRELEVIYQSSLAFGRLRTPEEVGERILAAMEGLLEYERGAIALLERSGGRLRLLAHARMDLDKAAYRAECQRVIGLINRETGVMRWVAEHGEAVRLGDAHGDPRYINADAGIRSEMCVPLQIGGRTIGAINVESRELDAFDEDDQRLLTILAGQASVAIENARLFSEAEAASERLRRLGRHLQSAREAERTAIAREIHDEFGQSLTVLKIQLAGLAVTCDEDHPEARERIDSMMAEVDASIRMVRRIAMELRPSVLDDLGLPAALQWLAEDFAGRTGIACPLRLPDGEASFERDVATTVFRVFQESLTNVARHAGATRVEAGLAISDRDVRLTVRDNGRGIGREKAEDPGSMGLIGMRERAYALGGTLSVRGRRGAGTTVVLTIPCRRKGESA